MIALDNILMIFILTPLPECKFIMANQEIIECGLHIAGQKLKSVTALVSN